jgi:cellulose synthase/poly-beta-1,6-N-acetylglucosamine synthase-like glycosyltransferase
LPALLTVIDFSWIPINGLPPVIQVLFSISFLIIVMMLVWTGTLFVLGLRADRNPPAPGGEEGFEWIFMVPALNEEVTIRDSVERLEQIPLESKRIVVINDGSDDGTAEVLGSMASEHLHVIERRPPAARQGKAAALNFAFAEINRWWPDLDPDRTIVCVVDADGRIAPESPRFVAGHFADPLVGGVQSLVRIYNRHQLLTWFQDIEFSIYGRLFQAGRNGWGTPGMGGNGQYNRLSALASIDTSLDAANPADEPAADGDTAEPVTGPSLGPWRDRLTEDQDLGLRLMLVGWHMRHDNRATVDQQGLPALRPLLRQRTRWSQGNLQAMGLIRPILRSRIPWPERIELILYLLTPIFQGIVGASLIVAIVLAIGGTRIYTTELWWLLFIYLLGFGGTMMGCLAARMEARVTFAGFAKGLLTAQIYAFYSWILWPVLLRSTFRQVTNRDTWAKTAREQIPD